jgi:glycosyltransferase involved in cell wall biosynthesis
MKILIVEPFLTGSHEAWARGYAEFSSHDVEILGLEGRHWKWRMHGGAVTLARLFYEKQYAPDLILATDMLDLTTFLALTRERTAGVPAAIYFHENQLSYPWPKGDPDPGLERDVHYGFINFTSALAADVVLFNSRYHMDSFLSELPGFLGNFPDYNEKESIEDIRGKSSVLPLGIDLVSLDKHRTDKDPCSPPMILWNHRWEYDKNPDDFFKALIQLADEGLEFHVAVLGESFSEYPPIFDEARSRLGKRIIQFGFAKDPAEYARLLWRSDILPVTSNHDFFGAAAAEAIYCGCVPLLPDRLAFPEHIPGDLRVSYLYGDTEDMIARLRVLINEHPGRADPALRGHAFRYDWRAMVSIYDRLLEKLTGPSPLAG